MLAWNRDLSAFPKLPRDLPLATPFVSIYARGALRGCFGSNEGLARAALGALNDLRYGPVDPKERALLVGEVSFLRSPRRLRLANVERELELGREGLAFVRPESTVLLLPSVARDEGFSCQGFLGALAHKAGAPIDDSGRLLAFVCDTLVVGRNRVRRKAPERAADAAASWLSQRISRDGKIEFGCDARFGFRHPDGPFLHARSAIVIAALAAHGGHPRQVSRARRWLARELDQALAGQPVAMFPEDRAEIAGTLALSKIAGVARDAELLALARRPDVAKNAWHAAQVVLALGRLAPDPLWRACVANLESSPWAPWTAMAARAIGDSATLARSERALSDSIRTAAPYRGGANVRSIPELALTAAAVEALRPSRDRRARAAVQRGRAFLSSHQFRGESIPAAFDPELAEGGFPLSPVAPGLRSDVTAHALLALI